MTVRVGTSGFSYAAWVGEFYHSERPTLREYADRFDCVEINATFYRDVSAAAMRSWRTSVGPNFRFTLKGPRRVSHAKRGSRNSDVAAAFCEAARSALGDSLAAVVWQLPSTAALDEAGLACVCSATISCGVKCAVELRATKWLSQPLLTDLSAADVCVVDAASSKWPALPLAAPRASWRYWRFHGPAALYASGYSGAQLSAYADSMRGADGFAFFNNDCGGHAFRDAIALRSELERVTRKESVES